MERRQTAGLPRERAPDSTFALLRDAYGFISKRARGHGTDLFAARIMLRPAIFVTGVEAARMFYHRDRFTRRRAMPPTVLKLLQDKGSVQLLDGEAHRVRKRMFLSLLGDHGIDRFTAAMAREWRERIGSRTDDGSRTLLNECQRILCRAACEWIGLPRPDEAATRERSREISAMIEGAGSVGPRNLRGLLLRRRTERWARQLIADTRAGRARASPGSPLAVVAAHTDGDGRRLEPAVAAVELLNLLRPTVAVAWYIVFAAHALRANPEWHERLAVGTGDEDVELFVQEVRRFYPFFPMIAGRANEDFDWRQHRFRRGDWVLLDLYGTNHDERAWDSPHTFRPGRFHGWDGDAYSLVPQGGGDSLKDHRCPGEDLTIGIMKEAVRLLTRETRYDVPEQDLSIDMARLPAVPASGFIMHNVRPV